MPRELPRTNADAHDFIQFRGYQSSVSHDATGVHFGTEMRRGRKAHKPLPVVPDDADGDDVPPDAVAQSVAELLVESNPMVCWGVACEVCGDVFDSPKSVNSHQSAHKNDPDHGDGGGTDGSAPADDGDDAGD